ncbi:hypothetical protein HMPREF0322_04096 [Desulfitobacterium hafniense DP7]|uniref:Uncharacterized protein n=1 Tax=Desulfitobacterium hafniense DP7 TaxID=537010 RepID=G9XSY9_DESHA|nr:hypothetical protein HMPREF0322_04096 [Desulfitobacterium hafniense DP7]
MSLNAHNSPLPFKQGYYIKSFVYKKHFQNNFAAKYFRNEKLRLI